MAAIHVRPAMPADAAAIARVHVESWRATYPGLLPDHYLVNLSPQAYAQRWRALLGKDRMGRRTFVVELEGDGPAPRSAPRVVGFASCGPQRTSIAGYDGEFYAVYLADHAHGQGLGRRLLASMAQDLLDTGLRSAVVWVLRDNPARWFYERLGGRRLAEQPISFAGTRLQEVAYGWPDLVPLARMGADPRVG